MRALFSGGLCLLLALALILAPAACAAYTVENINLTSAVLTKSGTRAEAVTAELFLPGHQTGRLAAIVIVNSSGGVADHIERYYARTIADNGVAVLVVDSFTTRGVKNTIADQGLVSTWQMENDAYAACDWLKRRADIDPGRIGIMGVSKGGAVALNTAFTVRRQWVGRANADFALHIPIAAGGSFQHRDVRTTGKPIFFLLGGLDDYAGVQATLDYADRIRAAGNGFVKTMVYPNAHHAWEGVGPVRYLPHAENYSHCNVLIENNGDMTVMPEGIRIRAEDFARYKSRLVTYGAHVGGGTAQLKADAAESVLVFLNANGFLDR